MMSLGVKSFLMGSVVYATGSFITAISPNIGTLMFGWSLVEGLGAIMVIPAIAALVAVNYSGKDRAVAYAIIGAISGAATARWPVNRWFCYYISFLALCIHIRGSHNGVNTYI